MVTVLLCTAVGVPVMVAVLEVAAGVQVKPDGSVPTIDHV
jgi:hypothetical protein